MNSNSGVSTEDAQYLICKGTYGGKTWSASEKQAACERYEQLTEKTIQHSMNSNYGLVTLIAVVILGLVLLYALRRRIFRPKRS